jgi:hypothetical protein
MLDARKPPFRFRRIGTGPEPPRLGLGFGTNFDMWVLPVRQRLQGKAATTRLTYSLYDGLVDRIVAVCPDVRGFVNYAARTATDRLLLFEAE